MMIQLTQTTNNSAQPRNTTNLMNPKELVLSCAPWNPKDDVSEQVDYLSSLLEDRREEILENTALSSLDDTEELKEIIDQFFQDTEASKRLVELWKESIEDQTPHKAPLPPPKTTPENIKQQQQQLGTKILPIAEDHPTADEAVLVVPKSKATTKERRKKSRSPKRNRTKKSRSPQQREKASSEKDLRTIVSEFQSSTLQDITESDGILSNHKNAKDSGAAITGSGNAYGGRGANRTVGFYNGKDVSFEGLNMVLAGKDLLQGARLVITQGHRYGLWGKNGVGKSTLLRWIATGGVPGWPAGLSVQMVEQEVLGSSQTIKESIRSSKNGTASRAAIEEELSQLEEKLVDPSNEDILESVTDRMSELYEQLDEIENREHNDTADSSVSNAMGFEGLDESATVILKGLQFKGDMMDTPVKNLSGGWRMRVALAAALYSKPDVLLLDEPTNHLDVSAVLFLEDFILEHEMTTIVVSHDAHFLDAICTDIIQFENRTLKYHIGNYSAFKDQQEQMWAKNNSIANATARKEKKALEFIQKQKAMSHSKHRDDNKQRQAKERESKLGRIGLYNDNGKRFKLLSQRKFGADFASHINGAYTNRAGFQSAHVDNSQKSFGEQRQLLNFKFPAATPLKGATGEYAPLITMDDCRFRYSSSQMEDWLLKDLTLNVSVGSRIAILGKNGAGKSTLVKLLCGELDPDSKTGSMHKHGALKVAHITQHHVEHLGAFLQSTPVEYFLKEHNAKNEHEARQFLGGFGLIGSLALQPIGTLSGGQKARLAFATVLYHAPHVLILDEPTNHLDSDSLESLAEAVQKFQGGAVVAVSHNQDFLSKISKEVWTITPERTVMVETVADPSNKAESETNATTFDDLYTRYKEGLRKESRRRRKR